MAMATRALLIIAWIIMVLLSVTQYASLVADVDAPRARKILAGLVFIIGAPIFCAYTALSGLLDYLLPEGWDNDDDDNEYKH